MPADPHRPAPGPPVGAEAPPNASSRPHELQHHARVALRAGHHAEALSALARAAALSPDDASICCDLGRVLAGGGDLGASLGWFERAAAISPGSLEARFFLGVTLLKLGRPADAAAHLRRAAALAPDDHAVARALADAAFHSGDDAAAGPALDAALRLLPGDEDLLLKRGEALARSGRHDLALAGFRDASARWPGLAGVWMALAQACEEAGHADEAEDAYRRALEQRQDWPQPLAGLLGLRRGGAGDADVAAAEALVAGGRLDDADAALLGYPLGRVHDARRAYVLAFACWASANAAREREVGALDAAGFEADVARQLAAPVPASGERDGDGEALVFVVGMPRSGTTLVEQVLATHHDASGCGELPFFAEFVARHADLCGIDGTTAAREAAAYMAIARRHGRLGATRLVDKAPLNALHLGHVARLFPSARVVWCRRDARDVALSIFSENFAKSARFATSLVSIATCINAQHRLMRHWQRCSGLRILELPYESMVADFEAEAQRIVAFCDLPWDAACLDFHSRARVVQTPSRWQVRQPVHRGSVGRWMHYADALAPLLAALDVPVEADGVPRS